MTFPAILEQIYEFFSGLMHNIIEVDYKVVYALCFLFLILLAISVLVSKAFCYTTRINKDCRKIMKFIKKNPEINETNIVIFNKKCFGLKTMRPLKNGWYAFIDVKYGYPSDFITAEQILTRRHVGRGISKSRLYSFRYISVLFIVFSLCYCLHYAYRFTSITALLPGLALLIFTEVIFDAIMNFTFTMADNSAVKNFYRMQESLDSAVKIQNKKDSEQDTLEFENAFNKISKLIEAQTNIVNDAEKEMLNSKNKVEEKNEPVVIQQPQEPKEVQPKIIKEIVRVEAKQIDNEQKNSKAVEKALKNLEDKINNLNIEKDETAKVDPNAVNPRLKALKQVIDFVVAAKASPATYRKVALMLIEAKKKFPEPQNQEILDQSIKKMYAVLIALKEKKKIN